MEISWDGVLPTPEQWGLLQGRAFECLEDIKGAQTAISTRAMLELLRRMGSPQGPSANLTKPRMAALIVSALVPHEGWATAVLGNVRLASSSRDLADLSALAFGLELSVEPPVRLFFPAGGVVPAAVAGNGLENEVAPPNAEAAATERPLDLAAILATLQQGFARLDAASAELKSGQAQTVGQLATLSEDTEGLANKVNRMGNKFEQEVKRIDLGQKRLEERLKQLETGRVDQPSVVLTPPTTDSGTSSSETPLPAPESYLPLAAQLAAANPARQNPKLIGQALSAAPPVLKLFRPKNASALAEEEQRVILEQGSLVVRAQQGEISSHGQLIGAANCFLDIWVAASKISTGEKSEYLDHLRRLRHCSTADLLFFHESLVSDLRSKDSFDIVGRESVKFVSHLVVLQTAGQLEEKKGRPSQSQQTIRKCYQCGATDHLRNQCPKRATNAFSDRGPGGSKGTRSSAPPFPGGPPTENGHSAAGSARTKGNRTDQSSD